MASARTALGGGASPATTNSAKATEAWQVAGRAIGDVVTRGVAARCADHRSGLASIPGLPGVPYLKRGVFLASAMVFCKLNRRMDRQS